MGSDLRVSDYLKLAGHVMKKFPSVKMYGPHSTIGGSATRKASRKVAQTLTATKRLNFLFFLLFSSFFIWVSSLPLSLSEKRKKKSEIGFCEKLKMHDLSHKMLLQLWTDTARSYLS